MPVGIDERYAAAPYQSMWSEKDCGCFQFAEQGIDDDPAGSSIASSSVNGRPSFPSHAVVAAVYLDQHALTRHPLPTNSVLRRPRRRGLFSPAFTSRRRSVLRVYVYAFGSLNKSLI